MTILPSLMLDGVVHLENLPTKVAQEKMTSTEDATKVVWVVENSGNTLPTNFLTLQSNSLVRFHPKTPRMKKRVAVSHPSVMNLSSSSWAKTLLRMIYHLLSSSLWT